MAEENGYTTLSLLKMKLGISTTSRDSYLRVVLDSVKTEMLSNHQIELDELDHHDMMFLIDFAVYRYENTGDGLPRSLQYRLHNMILTKKRADSNE